MADIYDLIRGGGAKGLPRSMKNFYDALAAAADGVATGNSAVTVFATVRSRAT